MYVNGYLYRQNNLTNKFLDLKLVEKEVLVEISGQICLPWSFPSGIGPFR